MQEVSGKSLRKPTRFRQVAAGVGSRRPPWGCGRMPPFQTAPNETGGRIRHGSPLFVGPVRGLQVCPGMARPAQGEKVPRSLQTRCGVGDAPTESRAPIALFFPPASVRRSGSATYHHPSGRVAPWLARCLPVL